MPPVRGEIICSPSRLEWVLTGTLLISGAWIVMFEDALLLGLYPEQVDPVIRVYWGLSAFFLGVGHLIALILNGMFKHSNTLRLVTACGAIGYFLALGAKTVEAGHYSTDLVWIGSYAVASIWAALVAWRDMCLSRSAGGRT